MIFSIAKTIHWGILRIIIFIILPNIFGDEGLWLATPISEALTFIVIVGYYLRKKTLIR